MRTKQALKRDAQSRITKSTHKELKILKANLGHLSISETIQFLLDEYANHQQERGERGRPTAKEN